jgi:hypothetical protein
LYRDVKAPVGTLVSLEISGECGGRWILSRGRDGWELVTEPPGEIASRVTIPQDLAWRLFTKGIDPESARPQIEIQGHGDLGENVLRLTAIVG